MGSQPEPATNDQSPTGQQNDLDPRVQRILDLMADSLSKTDSLEANIGAFNAEAMAVAERYGKLLTEVLNVAPETLAEFDEMMSRVDSYGRLMKHIETLSSLAMKLRSGK